MNRGYIFDYGGTLDTGGQHWGKVLWHAYERQQVPVTETQFRETYVHVERMLGKNPIIQPDFTFRQTLETKLRLQLDYLQEQRSTSNVQRSMFNVQRSTSNVLNDLYERTKAETAQSVEVLRALKRYYPMVLVSNFYGNIAVVLREFGFEGLFDHVIESAVVGVHKPDPQIFTLGVEALGLKPEEVIVVGDSIDKDIIPAKKAGCQTIWFKGEGWTDDPVDESIPDRIIKNIKELL